MSVYKRLKKVYQSVPLIRELTQIKNLTTVVKDTFQLELRSAPRYQDPKRLFLFEHQTFSQHGEDGAILEIFNRIGHTSRQFVEIGAGNGLENNTSFLLAMGWSGHWIEGNLADTEEARHIFSSFITENKLTITSATIEEDTTSGLIESLNLHQPIDLLSLDIDRHTYWLWSWLRHLNSRVVVVEYNSNFPASVDWKIPYHPGIMWDETAWYGASLKAFEKLGEQLGYSLVGCDISGTNAYFVRKELCGDLFSKPYTAENHYEPPRLHLAYRWGGNHPSAIT